MYLCPRNTDTSNAAAFPTSRTISEHTSTELSPRVWRRQQTARFLDPALGNWEGGPGNAACRRVDCSGAPSSAVLCDRGVEQLKSQESSLRGRQITRTPSNLCNTVAIEASAAVW